MIAKTRRLSGRYWLLAGAAVLGLALMACSGAAADTHRDLDGGMTVPPGVTPSPGGGPDPANGKEGDGGGQQPSTPGGIVDRGNGSAGTVSPPDRPVSSDPRQPTTPATTPTPWVPGPGQSVETVPAPIDHIEVVARLSLPAQYSLVISAGLPSGCAQPASYDWTLDGTTIRVQVLNRMLTGDVACTMIYGMYDVTIDLGSKLTPGVEYTIIVNGETLKFVPR